MVSGADRNASHLSSQPHGWLHFWSHLTLGITLLLLAMAAVTVLASPETSASHNRVAHRQALSRAQIVQHAARTMTLGASTPFTEPTTTTALLPIMISGYPPLYPWTGEIVATYPNCTLTRLFGFVLDQNGELVGDVWVHYWADNYDGDWDKSSWEPTGDHNWDGTLDNRPREVVWYACVVPQKKSWDCESNTVEAPTSTDCQNGIQVYQIDFRRD